MKPAGTHFDFSPLSMRAEEDWGPLQSAIVRWVLAHGGDVLLARIAAQASLADMGGDSALQIEDEDNRIALAAMPLVGNAASDRAPFILDGGLFYLRRNFARERAVALMLSDRLVSPDAPTSRIDIDTLFENPCDPALTGQRGALDKLRGQRLFVLAGAPGSGKTTTVLRMLMLLARESFDAQGHWPRISLAAPTGKAAQRLRESLLAGSATDFASDWHESLASVQQHATGAGTLHGLLGMRPERVDARFNAGHPLPADIVVVDEASMLDLALLRRLLDALPADARLLLVGDPDQLDSVGTGSVLQDIVAALADDAPQLQRLTHSFRADRALLPLNEAVRQGDVSAFRDAMQAAVPHAVQYRLAGSRALAQRLSTWADALLADIRAHGIDTTIAATDIPRITECLRTLRHRQLLCALREGPFGATGINAVIEQQLASALQGSEGFGGEGERWYPGRRILVTRNDASSGLHNGDIGLCLHDGERLRVWFDGGEHGPRVFETGALPPHEAAFALTVHKAQGSEYDEVAVLLPPQAEHPLLSRQWFYTAISRARRALQVWGSDAAIARAIERPARRTSGLRDRIRGET